MASAEQIDSINFFFTSKNLQEVHVGSGVPLEFLSLSSDGQWRVDCDSKIYRCISLKLCLSLHLLGFIKWVTIRNTIGSMEFFDDG